MSDRPTHVQESVSVWKFPVPQSFQPCAVDVVMPARSEIVRVGQQNDVPVVWAIVDPAETQPETRRLIVLPTGANSSEQLSYIGTTELYNGEIAAHVFEVMS